ncbi:hypothetical protein [Mesoaciditoga lauensis]|uniref:hypothetical protein n=1 Tax=Mesoaciditoga lauensis TaxID=1495039 RepID=UPI00068E4A05|nr:hypothetical protein [Mesoaciditoga lauensis]
MCDVKCTKKCIEKSMEKFLSERTPTKRYASFDYCYNYFYSFYPNNISNIASKDNIQTSCFQLGFYLASWGMFRGSSKLLQKSVKYFKPLIRWISNADEELWKIDVDSYEDNFQKIINAAHGIREALKENDNSFNPTETLVTKIMLGVFGNIPALDTYFSNSFGVRTVNEKGLKRIYKFYSQNKEVIDSFEIHTLDLATGGKTNIKYKKAKIIDMVGFTQGLNGQKVFK